MNPLIAKESGNTGRAYGMLGPPSNSLPGREIAIPFRDDMRQAILDGRKRCTSRNQRYGGPGDFFVFGMGSDRRVFRLTRVSRMCLDFVANVCYEDEGVNSPEEFIALWKQIHPLAGYEPHKDVFTHFFEEVTRL